MFHVKHFNLPEEKIKRIKEYVSELLRWNRRINLIGRDDEDWVWDFLVYPICLLSLKIRTGTLLDLGAGSGVGGFVLKIINEELNVTLAERREKKCVFLRYIKTKLGIDVDIYCGDVREGVFTGFDYLLLRGVRLETWHKGIARYIIYFGEVEGEWRIKEVIKWKKGKIRIIEGIE